MNRFQQFIQRKRLAYVRTFLAANGKPHPEALIVLADLARVSGINRGGIVVSPVSRMVDPYATAYRAGMRDVYLRITKFIGLDEAEELKNDSSSSGE